MVSIEEMEAMLGGMLDELPEAFFAQLNGGVNLLPEAKPDPVLRDVYILGEYVEDLLGRSIVLYYGSFARLFADFSALELRREVRKTLRHEFRHHLESLAGLDDLEWEDAAEAAAFLREEQARQAPEPPQTARQKGLLDGLRFKKKRSSR